MHLATHEKRRNKFEGEYIKSLLGPHKLLIGTVLANLFVSPLGGEVPYLLTSCVGISGLSVRTLVSNTVFYWISNRKAECGDSPWLQPTTMMTYVRTFFGHMKDIYDWRFNLD